VRAGSPPSAVEFVIRHHRIGWLDDLDQYWLEWERWFTELEEAHTSYPALNFLRSPQHWMQRRSWHRPSRSEHPARKVYAFGPDSLHCAGLEIFWGWHIQRIRSGAIRYRYREPNSTKHGINSRPMKCLSWMIAMRPGSISRGGASTTTPFFFPCPRSRWHRMRPGPRIGLWSTTNALEPGASECAARSGVKGGGSDPTIRPGRDSEGASMPSPSQLYASLRERVVGESGVVMLIGGPDTGKTSLAKHLLRDALARARKVAFVDADIGTSTVGPPACVGLRWIKSAHDFDRLHEADELRFVGSTEPQGVILAHVVAAGALVDVARRSADFIILDTTGMVQGVVGETLKYHLMEACDPALVVAMQRGAEMEPTIGMLQRFLGARVARASPLSDLWPLGPVEKRAARIAAFAGALTPPLARWRVSSNVFAPTLPEGFDLAKLVGMLVGIQDGSGRCLGLGVLEYEDHVLRVATHHGEKMEGLRLGSLRINLATFETVRVRLRQLIFGV
jgi:hypothetical protein